MSQTENKDYSVELQFKGIEILSQSINLPQSNDFSLSGFTFDIGVEIKFEPTNKLIFVFVNIVIFNNEEKQLTLGSALVSNIFLIANYDDIIQTDENGKITLPKDVIMLLNSMSLSTTRGVLFGIFKGTFLHNAILPIIDPKGINTTQIN